MKSLRQSIFLLFALASGAAMAQAQSGEPMQKPVGTIAEGTHADPAVCAPDGVAVGGYDLITYRTEAGPQTGSPDFTAALDGLTYRFVSSENRDRFVADPDAYLPKYSGWCAITLALGSLTCPDFRNFKIEDGDLLLFETTGFTNGQVVWNTDPEEYRSQADANFLRLILP